MDSSDKITHQIVRAIGNIDDDTPIARPAWLLLARLHLILKRDDVLETMARAHDAEEAAQKGEPSPWRDDLQHRDGCEHVLAPIRICDCPHVDPVFLAERRAAMLCALKAVGLA